MKKIIYLIGIYRVCMMIHNLPRALRVAVDEGTIAYGKIMKAIDEAKQNNTAQEMVMNRIGF